MPTRVRSLKSFCRYQKNKVTKLGRRVCKVGKKQESPPTDKVMWMSVLDTRTCSVCKSLHGKFFSEKDAFRHFPVHDFCRCKLYRW